jgi:hypothetical protein
LTKQSDGTLPSYSADLLGTTAQIKRRKALFVPRKAFFANLSIGLRSILMKGINRSGVYKKDTLYRMCGGKGNCQWLLE